MSRRTAIYLAGVAPVVGGVFLLLLIFLSGPSTAIVISVAVLIVYRRMWRGSWFTDVSAAEWGGARGRSERE